MRLISVLMLVTLITGCNSDTTDTAPEIETITISSLGAETTSTYSGVNVDVSGMNNTITVSGESVIYSLSVPGLNNLITVNEGATVEAITLGGSGNYLIIPSSLAVVVSDDGLGNTVTSY